MPKLPKMGKFKPENVRLQNEKEPFFFNDWESIQWLGPFGIIT